MSVSDLLFLVAFLTSLVTIAVAAALAVRGRLPRALKVLRIYCICAAAYVAVALVVAFLTRQRVMSIGDP